MVEWNIASTFNINICIWFNNFLKKEDKRRINTERFKRGSVNRTATGNLSKDWHLRDIVRFL